MVDREVVGVRTSRAQDGYPVNRIGRCQAVCVQRSPLVIVAALLALAGSTSAQQPAAVSARPALVFRGVTVIDVQDGQRRPTQTVVVVGNRVHRIGPDGTVPIPQRARIVNARGKYLIPGLWDMHVHPWDAPHVFYPLFVAHGVTGIRDAGSSTPLATLNRWKQEIAAGTRVGPRLFVAGPSIDGCPNTPGPLSSHQICVSTPSEARLVVDFLKLAGADFIKPHNISKELNFAILAEAKRIGIPVGGHLNGFSAFEAADSGARFVDHSTGSICGEAPMDSSRGPSPSLTAACADSLARLRRNGTWVVYDRSTRWAAAFVERFEADTRRYYPDSLLRTPHFAAVLKMLRQEHDSLYAGLPLRPTSLADFKQAVLRTPEILGSYNHAWLRGFPILAGTDNAPNIFFATPGYELHEALVLYVVGGMTPLEALQTATLNPALALRATDSLGTVAPGKLADLVLLDADPLVDIWNTTKIRAVVANGRYFDHAALDELRAQAEHAAHAADR